MNRMKMEMKIFNNLRMAVKIKTDMQTSRSQRNKVNEIAAKKQAAFKLRSTCRIKGFNSSQKCFLLYTN